MTLLIPLLIGARDMIFPKLNMLSVWTFTLASVIMLISFFVPGGAASAGWTGYPPLSARPDYTGVGWGLNLWLLGLALELAAEVGAEAELGRQARALYERASKAGYGKLDTSGVLRLLEADTRR